MIKKIFRVLSIILFTYNFSSAQAILSKSIDSVLNIKSGKPFNGIVLIAENDSIEYFKIQGYENLDKKNTLKVNNQFVIGSISKQITAVLILQEIQKGNIKLNASIKQYLPELPAKWTDSVTIHQLLTHTHGIKSLDKPLLFIPGSQYAYSQFGYELLAQILEKVNHQSLAKLSASLFKVCRMKYTFHPDLHKHKHLVKGYTEDENGKLVFEKETFENYVAAGGFISTAQDLLKWNLCLHQGKLLKDSIYNLMTSKQKNAIRQHPLFGETAYGYGITTDNQNNILQIGQTGFAPGFISMNFYFPQTRTSLIILENVVYDRDDLKKIFYYQTQILKLVKESF